MKHGSIFFRIFFPVLSLILLCTVTVSSLIYTFAQRTLYRDIAERSGALLIQIDGNFSNLMQQLNTVINVSDSSLYFRTLLTEPCDSQLDLFNREMELHRFLYNYYPIFTQFKACATIVGKNGVQYTTNDGQQMLVEPEEVLAEDWASALTEPPFYEQIVSVLSHPGITTDTQGKNVLLFARSLVNAYTMELCGWMFLEIDPAGFEQLYARSYGEGESIFITGKDGTVISSNRHDVVGYTLEGVEAIPLYRADGSDVPVYLRDFDGSRCLAVRVELSAIDGYLIKYIDTSVAARQLNVLKVWIAVVAALFCLAAGLFSFLLFRHITRPIVRLCAQMRSTRYGHVSETDTGRSRDEIQTLEHTFSNLLEAVDTYTENIRKESSARREAELNALRMQINPHFLYNTLSSIRYLADSGRDRAEISRAVDSFIRLLRGTISNRDESIPLRDELTNLNAYVSLMNLRYDGRICIQTVMSDTFLEEQIVPKLILQPVVENSIFHGFPEEDSRIDITLYISQIRDVVRIEVADSGCGIDEATLERLRRGAHAGKQSMTGVGLTNIDQRLKMIYGPQYGLTISSTVGMGTIVTLQLPATFAAKGVES